MRGGAPVNGRLRANLGPTAGPRFRIRDGVLEFLVDEWRAIGEAGFESTSNAQANPGKIIRSNGDGDVWLNEIHSGVISDPDRVVADTTILASTGDIETAARIIMPATNTADDYEVEMIRLPSGRPFLVSRKRVQ